MVYAKCININKSKHKYLLKDNNGLEMWVTESDLREAIKANRICIINLDNNLQISFQSGLTNYSKLSADKPSENSEKIYKKSVVVGTAPILDDSGCIVGGTYKTLYITDYTRLLDDDIQAEEIVFIGEQSFKDCSSENYITNIKCNKAIIMNKCIMSNLVSGPVLNAKEIEIKHGYVDENTVLEVYDVLVASYYNLDLYNPSQYRINNIRVHFENLDTSKIYNNIRRIYKAIEDNRAETFKKLRCLLYGHKKNNENKKYPDNLPQKKEDTYNRYLYKNIKARLVLLVFMVSMLVSLPDLQDKLMNMCNSIVDTLYKLVREYQWDYVNNTESRKDGLKLLDFALGIYDKYKDMV